MSDHLECGPNRSDFIFGAALGSLLALAMLSSVAKANRHDLTSAAAESSSCTCEAARSQDAAERRQFFTQLSTHREQSHIWLASILYALVLALAAAAARDIYLALHDPKPLRVDVNATLAIVVCLVLVQTFLLYTEIMFGIRLLTGVAHSAEIALSALNGLTLSVELILIDTSIERRDVRTPTPPSLWLFAFGAFGIVSALTVWQVRGAIKTDPTKAWLVSELKPYLDGLLRDCAEAGTSGVLSMAAATLFLLCWPHSAVPTIIAASVLLLILTRTLWSQSNRRERTYARIRLRSQAIEAYDGL